MWLWWYGIEVMIQDLDCRSIDSKDEAGWHIMLPSILKKETVSYHSQSNLPIWNQQWVQDVHQI
jgi:hypothetical protein